MKHSVSGDRVVAEGKGDEFLQRWTEFLRWTKADAPGFLEAHLLRDDRHFISLSEGWDEGACDAWRSHADLGQHLDGARSLCDDFSNSDYALATEVK